MSYNYEAYATSARRSLDQQLRDLTIHFDASAQIVQTIDNLIEAKIDQALQELMKKQ